MRLLGDSTEAVTGQPRFRAAVVGINDHCGHAGTQRHAIERAIPRDLAGFHSMDHRISDEQLVRAGRGHRGIRVNLDLGFAGFQVVDGDLIIGIAEQLLELFLDGAAGGQTFIQLNVAEVLG